MHALFEEAPVTPLVLVCAAAPVVQPVHTLGPVEVLNVLTGQRWQAPPFGPLKPGTQLHVVNPTAALVVL
jgi:hypothetical protein